MNKNGENQPQNREDDHLSFKQRLAAAQAQHKPCPKPGDTGTQQYNHATGAGFALRLATEMVAAVLVGIGLGHILDRIFNTSPLFLLIMLCFGLAAGILGGIRAYRNFNAMLTQTAHNRTEQQKNGIKRE